jgi:hypothetical protein
MASSLSVDYRSIARRRFLDNLSWPPANYPKWRVPIPWRWTLWRPRFFETRGPGAEYYHHDNRSTDAENHMRSRTLPGMTCFLGLLITSAARADNTADPLHAVPAQAELIFKIEQPRKLAQTIYDLDAVQELLKIEVVRELYNSTKAERLYQILSYFEQKLGHKRFDLLERLAGNGVVVAAKFSGGPAALVVVQAREEQLLKKFVKLGLDVFEQELARKEVKSRPSKGSYRAIDTVQFDKFHLAVAGSNLLLTTDGTVLKRAIDCQLEGGAKSIAESNALAAARKQLVPDTQAWAWLNLEALRTIPAYREGLKTITLQPIFYVYAGPLSDVLDRSPYLTFDLRRDGKQFRAGVRMPRGRKGMSAKANLFLPESGAGTLPFLEPAGVSNSLSYYLDLGKLWDHKDKWLGDSERKVLGMLEEKSAFFLGGIKLGQLLKQAGVHHRIVTVAQGTSVYKRVPQQPIGGFALVLDARDPAFGKSLEAILRGAALFASTQFNLNMAEEKLGPHTLVSYRFPEAKELRGDKANIRFNFSPAFARVRGQFIVSSTVELGRDLLGLLAKEEPGPISPATFQIRVYAQGTAAGLERTKDQLENQLILGQGLSPQKAQDQLRQLLAVAERLGVVQAEVHYGVDDFRYDIRWTPGSDFRSQIAD